MNNITANATLSDFNYHSVSANTHTGTDMFSIHPYSAQKNTNIEHERKFPVTWGRQWFSPGNPVSSTTNDWLAGI